MAQIMPKVKTVLISPESMCAATYSVTDSGAMNMLLRLRDQMFHRLPTDREY